MATSAIEIRGLQVHAPQVIEVLGSQAAEFVEQLRERLASAFALLRQAVEGIECSRLAVLQDHAGARHPVGSFAMN